MILSKALFLKGLGGLTACAGVVGLGVVGQKMGLFGKSIDPVLKELIEKVGLSCNLDNICTQVSGQTTNIKQESTTHENKTIPSSGSGKIKVYKLSGESTEYKDNFKFVIEGGDITIDSTASTKLEQFETYEIKEEGTDPSKKWYFSRKSKAEDEIKKALGLPSNGTSCTLPTSANSPTTCSNISSDQLKAIKFDGKSDDGASINSSVTATLTITKTTTDTTTFPLGYKFAFDPTEEVTISSSNKIAKKSGTEFKIKVTPSSSNTPVSLSLEKAWTVTTLAEKVGLVCPDPSNNGEKKCSFTDGSINVKNGESNDTIEGAKVKADSTVKKMNYLEDQENYSQGFKFTVDGSESITLTKDGDSGTTLNIENTSTTYEIKKDESDSKWYLTKKTTTGSSS